MGAPLGKNFLNVGKSADRKSFQTAKERPDYIHKQKRVSWSSECSNYQSQGALIWTNKVFPERSRLQSLSCSVHVSIAAVIFRVSFYYRSEPLVVLPTRQLPSSLGKTRFLPRPRQDRPYYANPVLFGGWSFHCRKIRVANEALLFW